MKKLLCVLLAMLMITAMAACTAVDEPEVEPVEEEVIVLEPIVVETTESGPVSYYGEMMVKDAKITSENTGNPFQVTGMSFFWSNWSNSYYSADYVDKMVDEFGCEVVRTAYGITDEGVPHSKDDVSLIKDVICAAIERDVYVIVDWHSHGAHNNPEEAVAFFTEIAQQFGHYDNVIFEVYNEPTDIQWSEVKAYAETVIEAIRKYSDNLIIVGSPTWSQDVHIAAAQPIDDDNVAYTLHFYAGTHKKWLRDRAEGAMEDGIALVITEWGSVNADGGGAIDYESTLEWINWCNENGISTCNWAINDKDETSSIFTAGDELTETGNFLKKLISDRTALSEWRTGKPYEYSEVNYDPSTFAID